MSLDRRQLLTAGSACLAACGGGRARPDAWPARLDVLLDAHASAAPENGGGANHYPMAAEALETLGHEDAIADDWIEGERLYAVEVPRRRALGDDWRAALGDYARFGDWLDAFRSELERDPWRTVVARWTPRLAPGLVGAAFHGLLRSAHAARALRRRETDARHGELALGLAYWAARYVELPVDRRLPRRGDVERVLPDLEHPWVADDSDVDFADVVARMTSRPLAPPVRLDRPGTSARAELDALVGDAATAFLEMLVLEQQRLWLLHTVTGPAAVEILLPDVDPTGARALVEYARQAVVAMYAAYGKPYAPRASVRAAPPEWPELVGHAVASRSVHTIKLTEALVRFARPEDPLWRSIAAQWLEWV